MLWAGEDRQHGAVEWTWNVKSGCEQVRADGAAQVRFGGIRNDLAWQTRLAKD